MELNPRIIIKENKLKMLIIKQRYDSTAPLIIKNTIKGTVSVGFTTSIILILKEILDSAIKLTSGMTFDDVIPLMLSIMIIATVFYLVYIMIYMMTHWW